MVVSLRQTRTFFRKIRFGEEGVEAGLVRSWEPVERDILAKAVEGIGGLECS